MSSPRPSPVRLVFFLAWLSVLFFHLSRSGVLFAQRGDLYLEPALGYPGVCYFKAWLLMFGSLGMLLWLNTAVPSSNVWSRVIGLGCYAAFVHGEAVSPAGLWCSALSPWICFAIECGRPGFLLLLPLCLLWAVGDSSFVCMVLPLALLATSSALRADRERAKTLFGMLLVVLLCSMLRARYVALSAEAISAGTPFLRSVLGWKAPNFQAEPHLGFAIVLLVMFSALLRPLPPERSALVLSAFLLVVVQSRSSGMLASVLALLAGQMVERMRLVRPPEFRLERFEPLALAFPVLGMALVALIPGVGGGGESRIRSLESELRAFGSPALNDLDLAEDLRKIGLDPQLEPDFQGLRIAPPGKNARELLEAYGQIVFLQPGWEQAAIEQGFTSMLLPRALPLAGVLLERDRWKVRGVSEPIAYTERGLEKSTPAMLLVPPATGG